MLATVSGPDHKSNCGLTLVQLRSDQLCISRLLTVLAMKRGSQPPPHDSVERLKRQDERDSNLRNILFFIITHTLVSLYCIII